MNIEDLIKAGQLSDARRNLVEAVKASPGDAGRRSLLAQILLFQGEWDKAERHLDLVASADGSRIPGIAGCRGLIQGERERLLVAGGKTVPPVIPEPPPYFGEYYEGCQKLRQGDIATAGEIFVHIGQDRPAISGIHDGVAFDGFVDTDAFQTFFLEAFVHGRYAWIPFEAIRELVVAPPRNLLDLMWASAAVTTWEGLSMNCHLPVLYAGSHAHDDDAIRMGRKTDWISLGGSYARAVGQHVFEVGGNDVSLLQLQTVEFHLTQEDRTDGQRD